MVAKGHQLRLDVGVVADDDAAVDRGQLGRTGFFDLALLAEQYSGVRVAADERRDQIVDADVVAKNGMVSVVFHDGDANRRRGGDVPGQQPGESECHRDQQASREAIRSPFGGHEVVLLH